MCCDSIMFIRKITTIASAFLTVAAGSAMLSALSAAAVWTSPAITPVSFSSNQEPECSEQSPCPIPVGDCGSMFAKPTAQTEECYRRESTGQSKFGEGMNP